MIHGIYILRRFLVIPDSDRQSSLPYISTVVSDHQSSSLYVYNVYVSVLHVCIYVYALACGTLIERNPPPRGGFLFTMFPHQEPCVRGPSWKNLYQVLRGGSSYTRFLMREYSKQETPPGGGFSFDQLTYS